MKFKHCPFCGSNSTLRNDYSKPAIQSYPIYVECISQFCGVRTPSLHTETADGNCVYIEVLNTLSQRWNQRNSPLKKEE